MTPELDKTGKASTSTNVYAFRAFCLDVAYSRRPVKQRAFAEEVHLVDWVLKKCWKAGDILKTVDSKHDFKIEGNQLGGGRLLCSHNAAAVRSRMSEIILYLSGQASLPENLDAIIQTSEFVEEPNNYSAPWTKHYTIASVTITESFQSRGCRLYLYN
ncbi:hypothetical protein REPUB_Repub06bG0199400 [Reevesia pubescens]